MARRGISGISENPDLENRLIALERKAASFVGTTAAQASPVTVAGPAGSSQTLNATPGELTGFSFTNFTPEMISMEWNLLKNISRYEILVSYNVENFNDLAKIKRYFVSGRQNHFNFVRQTDDHPDFPYYFKVRGIGYNAVPGPWSGTANSLTGKVTLNHLLSGVFNVITKRKEYSKTEKILNCALQPEYEQGNFQFIESSFTVSEIELQLEDSNAIILTGNVHGIYSTSSYMCIGTEFSVVTPSTRYSTDGKREHSFGRHKKVTKYLGYDPIEATSPWQIGYHTFSNIDVFDPPENGIYVFKFNVFVTWEFYEDPQGLDPTGYPYWYPTYDGFPMPTPPELGRHRLINDARAFHLRGYEFNVAELV